MTSQNVHNAAPEIGQPPLELRRVEGAHFSVNGIDLTKVPVFDMLKGFKDSGDLLSPEGLDAFSDEEMQQLLEISKIHIPNAKLRGI